MARTLHFRGQQMGDDLVKYEPDHVGLTPPVLQAGLFQRLGVINIDSINGLWAFVVTVTVVRTTPDLCAQAISAIMEFGMTRGDVEIKDTGVVKMRGENWVLDPVGRPNLLPAFGGRFVEDLVLRFEGETPPSFF